MTSKEKFLQLRKEAIWTGIILLVLIVFWLFAGFGLADVNITVFHVPLWAVTCSIGTWVMAMVLVKVLTSFIFVDMDFDDEEDEK